MPYASTSALPPAVKAALPTARLQQAWLKAFNAAFAEYKDDKKAFATAWATIGKIATKGKDGKWTVKAGKEQPAKKAEGVQIGSELTVVAKLDEDRRLALGWLSVNKVAGKYVIDRQGDIIPDDELEEAVIDFGLNSRVGKVMHDGDPVATMLVFPMTPWVQQALGIDLGKSGALSLTKFHDETAWLMVKDGSLPAMSIGGSAVREDAPDDLL